MEGDPMSQEKEYTLEEDISITAQSAVNIVLSTREGVDPVPFVAALLEGFARRVQTEYNSSVVPKPLVPSRKRRQGKSEKQENGH
jgi:hypothetical protein